MCLYPKIIINKKYTSTKKNGGIIPPLNDERVKYVPIGCGNCVECLKKKGRDWSIRLQEEIRHDNRGKFVTLSFSEESLKDLINYSKNKIKKNIWIPDNELATNAVRLFLERWRKKYKKSVKHWLITEKGVMNGRIHIHGIIFTEESNEIIEKIWQYGNIFVGDYVNEKTINYIVKYVSKKDLKHKDFTGKILTSAGIGKGYFNRRDSRLNRYKEGGETVEEYSTRQGKKIQMPIYYRNKIYTEEERERLWIEKIEKDTRYIGGEKIENASNKEELIENLLKYYQDKNERLGYSEEIKFNIKIYKKRLKQIQNEKKLLELQKENPTRKIK